MSKHAKVKQWFTGAGELPARELRGIMADVMADVKAARQNPRLRSPFGVLHGQTQQRQSLPLMNSTLTYPNYPGAKVDGPSRDAADNIAEHAMTLRDRVDALFDAGEDLTADECAERLNEDILSVRPRVSELRRKGRIEDAGKRRCNKSGMTATAWRRVAPAGVFGQQELL